MRFSLWFLSFLAGLVLPSSSAENPDYLIVGAGGSGLQMALFLKKHNISYTILEKEDVVGSFWTKFPVFEELISVNKWTRDPRERLRYDWHSFLEAPLGMLNVTEDYFPKGSDWHRYMALVSEMAGIHVEHGVEVERVANDGTPCVFTTKGVERCAKHRVFIGTGLIEKPEPLLRAIGGIPYSRITKEMAYRRRVCVLGNGNSGFEVAQNLLPIADRVTLYGSHPVRLSSVTRYTGDVRVKYLQAIENLNGKLLDTVDNFSEIPMPKSQGLEKILSPSQMDEFHILSRSASWLKQFECETFVITTGFKSTVPAGLTINGNFPLTTDWYQSTENPSIHYIGWLMHERDFRRGAGGFFSGFRYLVRNLVHHVLEEDRGIEYPFDVLTREEVIARVVERCQIADDLIILQDGVVLRDIIVPVPGKTNEYQYYQGVTYKFHPDLLKQKGALALYFTWGDGRVKSANQVFDGIMRFSDTKKLINLFLHPVIEDVESGLSRDIHEDLEMTWALPAYLSAIKTVLQDALNGNFAKFATKAHVPYQRPTYNQSQYGEDDYYQPAALAAELDNQVLQGLWKSVYSNQNPPEVEKLHDAMKRWMPRLFDHEEMEHPGTREDKFQAVESNLNVASLVPDVGLDADIAAACTA